MIEIYITNIRDFNESLYQTHFSTLPKNIQKEINKYYQPKDRYRTLAGKILLQNYLKKHTNFTLLDIKKTEYKKPYIENTSLNFNISHSGDYVVCAFNKNGSIGIDIEQNNNQIDLDDFKSILRKDEWQEIQNAPNKLKKFYTLWTIKEAMVKNIGRGLFEDIREIQINEKSLFFEDRLYYYKTFMLRGYTVSFVSKRVNYSLIFYHI